MTKYTILFIENFKALRGEKSVNQIAKETGIPQATLNRYANGTSEPKTSEIMTICKNLNCTPNDILL